MRSLLLLPLILLFSSCGYHVGSGGGKIAVSVPYVRGDFEGELTDAIISALSHTANFRYTQGAADWILECKILRANNDRIGYRYKRVDGYKDDNNKWVEARGYLCDNIVGIENRKLINVEVKIVDAATGDLVLGPEIIQGQAEYDYFDQNSLADLETINPQTGARSTVICFSLGQLDNVGTAGEDAIYPIYRHLAQKIVDGMIASGDDD